MKNRNYESSTDNSNSISTDSLEISSDSSQKSISASQLNKSTNSIQLKKQHSSKQLNMKTMRQRIPIRKELVKKTSNCENVSCNKINQETNTIKPVYPEIFIKHFHNNKVTEKVIPAEDGSLVPRKPKPKSYLEVIRHGEKNGKLSVIPNGKNAKSYLEIFQLKNGIKVGPKTETDKSTMGDDTPRDFCDYDFRKTNCYLQDDSSFYLKHLEEAGRKPSMRYPSQATILSESTTLSANSISRSSSLVQTSSGLTSLSEQMLAIREITTKTPRILTPNSFKKNRFRVAKVESNTTKEKLEKYIRQREYGQTVSNLNRIKIIQTNIKNSEQKSIAHDHGEGIIKNVLQKKPNIKKIDSKIQKVDIMGSGEQQPLEIEEIHKNKLFDRRNKNIQSVLSHGTLKSLHNRHLKEQQIVEKLRATDL